MKRATILFGWVLVAAATAALAQTKVEERVPVTVQNFIRAESDFYLGNFVKSSGGIGLLHHVRELTAIDQQSVIRMNRDTLYSSAVFDLDAGPVTITLPDSGKRFMSLQMVNQDHYTFGVAYTAGPHTYTRQSAGTRYAAAMVRTLVSPQDAKDVEQVHALQDAMKVSQKSTGRFEVPNWDAETQRRVREALLALAATSKEFSRAFGSRQEVDPVMHLLGTAAGWGGNPDKDATYVGVRSWKTTVRLCIG